MKHALSEYARTKLSVLRDNLSDDDVGRAWRDLLSDFVHHARYLGLDAIEGEERGESVYRLRRGGERLAFQVTRGSGQPRITSSAPCSGERLIERLIYDRASGRLVDRQGREPMEALVEEVCAAFGALTSVEYSTRATSTSSVRCATRPSTAPQARVQHPSSVKPRSWPLS